jgi:hypothetical protein
VVCFIVFAIYFTNPINHEADKKGILVFSMARAIPAASDTDGNVAAMR